MRSIFLTLFLSLSLSFSYSCVFPVLPSAHIRTDIHLVKTKKKKNPLSQCVCFLSFCLMPKKHDGIESVVMIFSFSYCDVFFLLLRSFFSDMCQKCRLCSACMINCLSRRTADLIVCLRNILLTFLLLFLGFTCAMEKSVSERRIKNNRKKKKNRLKIALLSERRERAERITRTLLAKRHRGSIGVRLILFV